MAGCKPIFTDYEKFIREIDVEYIVERGLYYFRVSLDDYEGEWCALSPDQVLSLLHGGVMNRGLSLAMIRPVTIRSEFHDYINHKNSKLNIPTFEEFTRGSDMTPSIDGANGYFTVSFSYDMISQPNQLNFEHRMRVAEEDIKSMFRMDLSPLDWYLECGEDYQELAYSEFVKNFGNTPWYYR